MNAPFPLTLRAGTPDEVDALVELAVAAKATSVGAMPELVGYADDIAQGFRDFITAEVRDLIVADRDGVILGFSATEGATDEISDVWVAPANQGQGVGGMLLTAAEARVRASGFSSAWLTTHAGNVDAIRFYRAQGYALQEVREATTVSPVGVTYLRAKLVKRLSRPTASTAASMAEVREGIDGLDPILLSLLAERFAFIDKAAELKGQLGWPARLPERVEQVVANARLQAETIAFDADVTETLWRTMIDLAIAREERLFQARAAEDATL